ncbi:hypothetical protein [Streptomyces sp. NPDC058751]|uniref:hypothetical protein n=1 Tax=Streptomyces sp. NPDC058751 TaxID=3346623 RepID=UPI00368CF11E
MLDMALSPQEVVEMAEHQRFNYDLSLPVEREVVDADEFDAFVESERARRYRELGKEVAQLRQEVAQLPDILAPRSATTSLSIELSQLRDAVTQLRQKMEERTSAIEKAARRDAMLTNFGLRTKMTALEQEVAGLRRQLQEASDSSKPSGSEPEEPTYKRRDPSPPMPRYQQSDSKPYRYASDIEYMMRQTPRAISEWEKPYDPYRDRD